MKHTSRNIRLTLLLTLSIMLTACGSAATPTAAPPAQAPATEAPTQAPVVSPANPSLILATTTSTQDSGLLDVLIPLFEAETGYKVKTVAVGSGEAIKMGQEGNADVLLVHSPAAEATFMSDGWGKERSTSSR